MRDPRDPHPPPNATLALWVDLQCASAAEAIEWLHRSRKSGFLRLSYRDHRKAVYFREGEVVFASSNQRIDRLGPCLARQGVLSLDELRAANREVRPQERFGKTLVTHGYLEPRHLWDGIRDQLEEIVWSVMAYREGVLAFWQGEVTPDNLVRIDFNTRALLDRGREWREELEAWIEAVRGDAVRISSVETPGNRADLDGLEAHITDALLGDATFEEVCRRSGFDLFTVARTLRLLEDAGCVEIRRLGDDPESTFRAHNDARVRHTHRRLAAANRCIEGMLKSLEPYEMEGLATRTRAAFDEIAARFPGVLAELALTHQLLLPVDALEKRLFDAPAELRRDAFEAVAALLDYLEFELMNHAQVEDAAELLETLRPFREEATR